MSQPLELEGMKHFVVLAEELHFGRAARRLNMTQPALSQRIRRLEAHLGSPLFVRTTRTVRLSPAGRVFLPLCREALTRLDEAVVLAKIAAGGLAPGGEQLRVGAIVPAAHGLLPLILRRFHRRFPVTTLDVRIYDSVAILRALERGDCDVGIIRPPSNVNQVRFRPLMAHRFVAAIPWRLPLAVRPVLRLADFAGQTVFTLDRFELSSFQAVHAQIEAAGIRIDPSVRVSNTTAALALVAAGLGITFLPEWVEGIVGRDIVLRRVDDLIEEIPIGIAWRADNPSPGILPFVSHAELAVQP